MGLAIKRRYSLNIFHAALVFASSFSLSYIVGSLTFIPYESSADTVTDPDAPITLALNVESTNLTSEITPTYDGAVLSDDIDITIDTNSQNGYTLTMSVSGSTTGLTHTNNFNTIPSTTNPKPKPLTVNTWGYNTISDHDAFQRLPGLGSGAILANTRIPTTADKTAVTIGVHVDTDRPSGKYTSTLQFTAVAN